MGCPGTLLEDVLHGHVDAVYKLAFSGDGGHLASCSHDLTASLWQMTVKRAWVVGRLGGGGRGRGRGRGGRGELGGGVVVVA